MQIYGFRICFKASPHLIIFYSTTTVKAHFKRRPTGTTGSEKYIRPNPQSAYPRNNALPPRSRTSRNPGGTGSRLCVWESENQNQESSEIIRDPGDGRSSPGQVVKRRHPETGHDGSLPLFGQQLVPHGLLTALRMLHLLGQTQRLWRTLYHRPVIIW